MVESMYTILFCLIKTYCYDQSKLHQIIKTGMNAQTVYEFWHVQSILHHMQKFRILYVKDMFRYTYVYVKRMYAYIKTCRSSMKIFFQYNIYMYLIKNETYVYQYKYESVNCVYESVTVVCETHIKKESLKDIRYKNEVKNIIGMHIYMYISNMYVKYTECIKLYMNMYNHWYRSQKQNSCKHLSHSYDCTQTTSIVCIYIYILKTKITIINQTNK